MSDTWPATDLTLTHHVSSAGDKKGSVFTPRDYMKQIVLLKCKITMVVNEKYLSAILLNLKNFNGLFCMQKQNYKQYFTSSSLWMIDKPILSSSSKPGTCPLSSFLSFFALFRGQHSQYKTRNFGIHCRCCLRTSVCVQ